MTGILRSINVSDGGVPKRPRTPAEVRPTGVQDDRQGDLRYHGGPERAVCLYSLDLLDALKAEGHPIEVGSIGENFTVAGLDWKQMVPGAKVMVGAVELEITDYAGPCSNLLPYFLGGRIERVSQKVHPGWSRLYARVLREGTVQVGDRVSLP